MSILLNDLRPMRSLAWSVIIGIASAIRQVTDQVDKKNSQNHVQQLHTEFKVVK